MWFDFLQSNNLLRVVGGNLQVKTADFQTAVKATKEIVKSTVKALKGQMSVSGRIPVTAKKISRNISVPLTGKILHAVPHGMTFNT